MINLFLKEVYEYFQTSLSSKVSPSKWKKLAILLTLKEERTTMTIRLVKEVHMVQDVVPYSTVHCYPISPIVVLIQ